MRHNGVPYRVQRAKGEDAKRGLASKAKDDGRGGKTLTMYAAAHDKAEDDKVALVAFG